MELYTKEQIKKAYELIRRGDRYFDKDEILEQLTPIELPSHRDITERANQQVDKTIDNYFVGFAACSEYYEQILNQNK